MKKVLIFFILCCCVCTVVLGCNKKPDDNGTGGEKGKPQINLNSVNEILGVGENVKLVVNVENAKNKQLIWRSRNELIASVDENGLIIAQSAGETEIIVATSDNEIHKACRILIGNILVSKSFTGEVANFNTIKFNSVKKALEVAKTNDVVIVYEGVYADSLVIEKNVSIIGINNPRLNYVNVKNENLLVKIENVDFFMEEYPKPNSAVVNVNEKSSLILNGCNFEVESLDAITGGYAVLAMGNRNKLSIKNCEFTNFRYAILLQNVGGNIEITSNTITACTFGIGINVKLWLSNTANNPTNGIINDNVYKKVTTNNEFIFNGSSFNGGLDFGDIKKL